MPGSTTARADQTQSQTTSPWGPTQGLLAGVVDKLGNFNTNVTPEQKSAISDLYSASNGLPNFSPEATSVAGKLFGSEATQAPLLSDAYNTYKSNLSPYLASSYLDPMSTPGLSTALNTTMEDIKAKIGGQFAASGGLDSPRYAQALGRGLSQGLAPILTDQFNRNVSTQRGAMDAIYGAGGNTATGLTNLQQIALDNNQAGLTAAGAIPGLAASAPETKLAAATQGASLPFSNLGWLTSSLLPIAGLGGQRTGTSTGTQTPSMFQDALMASNIFRNVT